jgi:hypothetical protein
MGFRMGFEMAAIIGYPTRALIYFVGLGLWLAGWYLLPLFKLWERPLGSITLGELVTSVGVAILYGWIGFKLFISYAPRDEEPERDVENLMVWGILGVAIAVVAGAAVLWLTYG